MTPQGIVTGNYALDHTSGRQQRLGLRRSIWLTAVGVVFLFWYVQGATAAISLVQKVSGTVGNPGASSIAATLPSAVTGGNLIVVSVAGWPGNGTSVPASLTITDSRNKMKEGVVTLPSGLQYKILKEGTGLKPSADDFVVCNYRGMLIDDTEFDSSYKRGQPATFPVGGAIKGWTEALQLMPVGSKWQLFVPSELAYGQRAGGPEIGPNAILIFEIELLSNQGKPVPGAPPPGLLKQN